MAVNVEIAKKLVNQSYLYVQVDHEAMFILGGEEDYFYAEGEESGESYRIEYTEVDVEKDFFYKLQLIGPESV